jgi:hemerythrin-like metal-binding protein
MSFGTPSPISAPTPEHIFAAEEELMATCAYPDLLNHRSEHIEFLARIHALAANSSHVQAKDLFDALRKSLLRHFLTTDRDYTACVKSYLGLQP